MQRLARWLEPALVVLTPALTIAAARSALDVAFRENKLYRYVVLDLRLPDGDGLALARDLVRRSERPSIGVISGYLEADVRLELEEIGIPALDKPVSREQIRRFVALLEHRASRTPEGFCERSKLSVREVEVYALVLDGFSRKEIADRLAIEASTVRTIFDRIKFKTNCDTREQLLRCVLGWCTARRCETPTMKERARETTSDSYRRAVDSRGS
jgi:DNA-binding NarL/FixJ family response regulator